MQKEAQWSCPQGSVGETDREGCLEKVNSGGRVSRGLVLTLMSHLFVVQILFISLSVSRDLRHLILLFCAKCSNEAVFAADFHPTDTNIIVTCGKSHLYFWTLEGSSLIKKQGLFEVR